MSKVCVTILCGVPGSGKTTVAQKLCERSQEKLQQLDSCQNAANRWLMDNIPTHFHHVCYDQLMPRELELKIINCSQGDETYCKWKHQRRKIVQCIERFMEVLHCYQEKGQLDNAPWALSMDTEFDAVILKFATDFENDISRRKYKPEDPHIFMIDDNMYYRSMRYEYFQAARKYNAAFSQIHVTCPLSIALERNGSRAEVIPDHIIKNMAEKMEVPKTANFWEKYSIEFDSSQDLTRNMDAVYGLIGAALADPFKPVPDENVQEKELSRVQCSTSVLHQADLILRKLVAAEMLQNKETGITKVELYIKAKAATERKSDIYNKLRDGTLLIPHYLNENSANASKDVTSQLYLFIQNVFQTES